MLSCIHFSHITQAICYLLICTVIKIYHNYLGSELRFGSCRIYKLCKFRKTSAQKFNKSTADGTVGISKFKAWCLLCPPLSPTGSHLTYTPCVVIKIVESVEKGRKPLYEG